MREMNLKISFSSKFLVLLIEFFFSSFSLHKVSLVLSVISNSFGSFLKSSWVVLLILVRVSVSFFGVLVEISGRVSSDKDKIKF